MAHYDTSVRDLNEMWAVRSILAPRRNCFRRYDTQGTQEHHLNLKTLQTKKSYSEQHKWNQPSSIIKQALVCISKSPEMNQKHLSTYVHMVVPS